MLQTPINLFKTFIPKQHRQMDGQTDSQCMAVGRDIGFLHIEYLCIKKCTTNIVKKNKILQIIQSFKNKK